MKRLSLLLKICLVLVVVLVLMRATSFDFISYSMLDGIGPAVAESIEAQIYPVVNERPQPAPIIKSPQSTKSYGFEAPEPTPDKVLRDIADNDSAVLYTNEPPTNSMPIVEPTLPFFEIGEHIRLLPKDSGPDVSFPSTFQILAQLENPYPYKPWRIQVEATVTHQDGSMLTAVKQRAILLFPGQSIELPIEVKAKAPKYQPGMTHFTALIKDMSGQIIDEASITFNFELSEEF